MIFYFISSDCSNMTSKKSFLSTRLWLATGAFYGMTAVVLSSFTSHLPDQYFFGNGREMARIADTILLIHSIALIAVSILQKVWQPSIHLNVVGCAFNIGLWLFCGAVFYTALTGLHPPIPLAPMGGSTLIISWLYLTIAAFLVKDRHNS
ncbi:TMEM256/DUF423 family (YgdD) [Commensalibacter communis]|nr:TMEM256/DUF423 family (YgdD) [Commensalibacter communis]CAI3931321.1 TMEM256/DUF423 family (YgdD) [Commensalibacter communis]